MINLLYLQINYRYQRYNRYSDGVSSLRYCIVYAVEVGPVCVKLEILTLLHTVRKESVPLAWAVHRLLVVIVHRRGISSAVQLNDTVLEAVLTAALAETCVTVNVEIEDGGRRTFSIAWVHCHLMIKIKKDDVNSRHARRWITLYCISYIIEQNRIENRN